MACLNIREGRSYEELVSFASPQKPTETKVLAAFNPEELKLLSGASLFLVGHYYACDDCLYVLRTVGITEITLDKDTGEKAREIYEAKRLT